MDFYRAIQTIVENYGGRFSDAQLHMLKIDLEKMLIRIWIDGFQEGELRVVKNISNRKICNGLPLGCIRASSCGIHKRKPMS